MKRVLALALAAAWMLPSPPTVRAQHDSFQYKWPWPPSTTATVTTYPFADEHGCYPSGRYPYECVAAYDLVIANDGVVSSDEGTVDFVDNSTTTCTSSGYGTFADVGGMRYAHLAVLAPSVAPGATLLQGDAVGTQGNTGNTLPPTCGKHLHWQFFSGSVPTINGNSGTSSNSVIGEFSTSGATLRSYFVSHGSWSSIGWTHDLGSGLPMFPNLLWGRMQDFQHHPDFFGAQFATIQVTNWDQTNAYRVDSLFWQPWASGGWDIAAGFRRPISMAIQESGGCPSGSVSTCVSYQRFHLGYVWVNNAGSAAAGFCPDVWPVPNGDSSVGILDSQWVFSRFQSRINDPHEDIDGDGGVTIRDAQIVFAQFQRGVRCRP